MISIDLRNIRPRSGDRREDFEELSYLLFARENTGIGTSIRRHGAGGDAGLEGIIISPTNHILKGVQAKFFVGRLDAAQWRDLNDSICTALKDNSGEGSLSEIVVTLPRKLTQNQQQKWEALTVSWKTLAVNLEYKGGLEVKLWDESHIRDLLLQPKNRGLLLHYFEVPDFDATRCRKKTLDAIQGLGDRYRPELHVATEAEEVIHTFLRSERSREQFVDEARERLGKGLTLREPTSEWPEELRAHYDEVVARCSKVAPLLLEGVSLPASFTELAAAVDAAADSFRPLLSDLFKLIPLRKHDENDNMRYYPGSRHPNEEIYQSFYGKERELSIFAAYLRSCVAADAQCLLFTGEPGRGKTHVLAEVCTRYSEQGGVVLFIEGASFTGNDPPWTQLMRWAGFPNPQVKDFLAVLSAMAQTTQLKVLICIDALNETPDRNLWRSGIHNFSAELKEFPDVKLIVSCRSDYMRHTLPDSLSEHRAPGWAFAEHQGLGIRVLEALPKYLKAYNVRGFALPPLTREFRVPLFLRIFCEAYADQTPESGSPGLSIILQHYAQRKARAIASRIDCAPSQVLNALRAVGGAMHSKGTLQLDEELVRQICKDHHAAPESSRALYGALLSEGILAEIPGPSDLLGAKQLVRFTYERVWDYFLSEHLLSADTKPSSDLLAKLKDYDWRYGNVGVFSMLAIRLAEERNMEVCDLIAADQPPEFDVVHVILESFPWRTKESFSARTAEIIGHAIELDYIQSEFDVITRVVPNAAHPWNADHLHAKLAHLPLAERDRTWTMWLNEALMNSDSDAPLAEWLNWAEHSDLRQVPPAQLLLLATLLAWCLTTTVVAQRMRLASALTRVLAGRTEVACQLASRFIGVDDPYVKERVLLALAGSAQHAAQGDVALGRLAQVVHAAVFSGKEVEPHLLVRHYAAEICLQAEAKGVLPRKIKPQAFRAPWRSKWPKIWSVKKVAEMKQKLARTVHRLFYSVEPGPGFIYGDWGRYVMSFYIHYFQGRRLNQPPDDSSEHRFDAQLVKRYVIQRVFELGWDPTAGDTHPEGYGDTSGSPQVERLSKKYQWIALYEMLGYLADHYHFGETQSKVKPFLSARQINPRDLLDPFVVEPPRQSVGMSWNFVCPESPWWKGKLDPFPRPLSHEAQRVIASRREMESPRRLIELHNGNSSWLTLSAYHRWNEPVPILADDYRAPHVCVEWAIQSYLVRPDNVSKLLAQLNAAEVGRGRNWLEVPEFGQPMASLKDYPFRQERLARRCELDNQMDTNVWKTGAISTTCRCAPDEDHCRARVGSMPSPQLAELGKLHWTGEAFDFAQKGSSEPVVRHMGPGFNGACVVNRCSLESWLKNSGWCVVWRCYVFKFRTNEDSECHARTYWAAYSLDHNNEVKLGGGATGICPDSRFNAESLPWTE